MQPQKRGGRARPDRLRCRDLGSRNHMDGRTACPHSSLRQIVGKGEEWGELSPQSIPGGLGLARSWGRDPLLSKHCCEYHTAMFQDLSDGQGYVHNPAPVSSGSNPGEVSITQIIM